MLKRLLMVGVVILTVAACTPQQASEWLGWRRHDRAGADAWLNSPEGIQSLTDPNIDVPAPPPPAEPERGVWDRLAWCESGERWAYNGSSGYDGGLQFLPSTWRAYGGQEFAAYAWQASRTQQITVAERVLDDVGWGAWPTCSRRLGLR